MAPREFPRSTEYQQQNDKPGQIGERSGNFKIKHIIGEEDPIVREERKKHRQDDWRVFGVSALEELEEMENNPVNVEDLRKQIDQLEEDDVISRREQGLRIENLERQIALLESGKSVADGYGDEVVHRLFAGFGNDGGWHREHLDRLVLQLKEDPQLVVKFRFLKSPDSAIRMFQLKGIHFSAVEAKKILQARVGMFLGHETQEFLKSFEQFRQEFRNLLPRLVEWNFISEDQLKKLLTRLDRTKASVEDPLQSSTGNFGDYQYEEVRIKLDVSAEQMRKTTFHELIHAISGRTLFLDPTEDNSVKERKLGLEHSRRSTSVLRWLNEALTEWLAAKLYGGSVSAYAAEVDEFEKMIASGLSPELFYQAYFEDADPKRETGKSAPAFGALMQRIKEIEGKNAGRALKDHEQTVQIRNNKALYHG